MSTPTQNVAAQILAALERNLSDADAPSNWLIIGDALAQLEALGPQSADGRTWAEVVREVHEKLGYGGLSLGHLQKLRRVRNFVRRVLDAKAVPFTDREIATAQVSALEVAERLHALDPERGQAGLIACIGDRRKFVDMQREYDTYIEGHPDRLPKKRATWLSKRKSAVSSDDAMLVERIVLSDPEVFLGTSIAVLRPFEPGKASPFLRATEFGFRIDAPDNGRTLGIDLVGDDTELNKNLTRTVSQLEFQSSFFDYYWVFVKKENTEHVGLFSSIMTELRIDRVGLLGFVDDEWRVILRPHVHPPIPDRRSLLKIM